MIRNGFTCRHIMVQSVYILNILTGQYRIFSYGLKKEFETALVNKPSVFEPLKFYCTVYCSIHHHRNINSRHITSATCSLTLSISEVIYHCCNVNNVFLKTGSETVS